MTGLRLTRRGAVVAVVLGVLYMWAGSAFATWISGVPG